MNPMPANSCSRPSTAERSSALAWLPRRGAGSTADLVGSVVFVWPVFDWVAFDCGRGAAEPDDAEERAVPVDRELRVDELRALGPHVAMTINVPSGCATFAA